METISYTLPPEQDGATVRHILKAALHVSSHAISRLTRTETGIRVNGIHARTVDILHTGAVLEVEHSDHRPPRVRPTPGPWPLPIVWEDGHLLVVNKPAGMTAHASNFLPDTPTVAGALAWQRGADFVFHPVNRLDKGTTGLMVVAKSGYIHDRLRYALHTERFCREYRAVCIGCPDPKSGTIDAPIARLNGSLIQRTVDFASGERSVTHYRTLAHCSVFSHLELNLETGRTHQIRVHMAYIGHPLLGDTLYNKTPGTFPRQALHSASLSFVHPITGEPLNFHAPLPEDMQILLTYSNPLELPLTGVLLSLMELSCLFAGDIISYTKFSFNHHFHTVLILGTSSICKYLLMHFTITS